MSDPTADAAQRDAIIARYRTELVRLNYIRETINVYIRSIRRLFGLMEEHGVTLGDLTPDIAADLVVQAPWRCDRQQYGVFIVRRFVEYLAAHGVAKPPPAPSPQELARAALCHDYEDYLRSQRGISERTIADCWRFADRFLRFRFGEGNVDFGRLAAGDVVGFLQKVAGAEWPSRNKTQPTYLRTFCQ
jgi:integrase/recombinase XerD